MGKAKDRTKAPPPFRVFLKTWEELDAFERYLETTGGKKGPTARVMILKGIGR